MVKISVTGITFKLIIISILSCIFGFTSCNKNDNIESPISIYGTGDSINIPLYWQNTYFLHGGDGNYTVECDNLDIVYVVMTSPTEMHLQTLSIGYAIVTVSDQSGHTLQLQVYVDYLRASMLVTDRDVTIAGDLSDTERQAIYDEALRTFPVQVNGGYQFTFTDSTTTGGRKGTVIIYPEQFATGGVESACEIKSVNDENETFLMFSIDIDGATRTFKMIRVHSSQPLSGYALTEDITDRFKAKYPGITLVYTSQVIRNPET
jgi:hypothetical protein